MGGGPSTPELVAAVSNAGGLGSLGAAYLTPDQITDAIRRIRTLTSRPFNVNLFAGGWNANQTFDAGPMLEHLGEIHDKLGLPAPVAPTPTPDPFPAQFEAVLEERAPIFSFTFGIPERDAISRLKSLGIVILGTSTTVEEARHLEQAGVDAVVAQGAEAGAHRGTFLGSFESSMVPTLDLVRATVSAVSLPVIATGGIMDGRDIVAALHAGASAAQLGTAFLTCPESGASEVHKRAILAATEDTTVVTQAFSGRAARGIRNAFMANVDGKELILPYPLQNSLTRPMRSAAAQQGLADYLSLWAGQGVARARAMPAGDLGGEPDPGDGGLVGYSEISERCSPMVARCLFYCRAHGRGRVGGERCAYVSRRRTDYGNRYRAEDLATPGAFARDPKLVWEWYDWRRSLIAKAEPNPGHYALAAAETRARNFTLITQNVDGLHELAGSRNVLRLHGSIWMLRCLECKREREDRRSPLPEIPPRCECGGMLRPGVVWFGEPLPSKIWQDAETAARQADLFLLIGTSAVVYPAAGLGLDREIIRSASG